MLKNFESVALVGGAGFVGSHFADRLLAMPELKRLVIFDNFSSGRHWHYEHHLTDSRLSVLEGDVRDLSTLTKALAECQTVIHFASNPDIAAAISRPSIDFDQGTLLTHCVAEAARIVKVRQVLYASGSGVYGERGYQEVDETFGPLFPVSTYAASKIAGEALLCSYATMFGIKVLAFRFGNIVGPRQTHGVGFDFIRKLTSNPTRLDVLGDGNQTKSYVYVDDVVNAVLIASERSMNAYDIFNVATLDTVSVREIAELAISAFGLDVKNVEVTYSGGDRGWKGDVPVVRLSSNKIRKLGWVNQFESKQAVELSLKSMRNDPRHFESLNFTKKSG